MPLIKICGLSTPKSVEYTCKAGADFIGFVFYPPSPRHLEIENAAPLSKMVPKHIKTVAVTVDPNDKFIEDLLKSTHIDFLQLHGQETPERIKKIKQQFAIPIIKAIRIANSEDVQTIAQYEAISDWILCDAKTQNTKLPGGTGHQFDWSLLKNVEIKKPWFLSGGINETNLKDAYEPLRPTAIDISSGVESHPGIKDNKKIDSIINNLKSMT